VDESPRSLTSLSDEELMAQYNRSKKPLSELSDEELMAQYNKPKKSQEPMAQVLNES
jgi:hypothetical protein